MLLLRGRRCTVGALPLLKLLLLSPCIWVLLRLLSSGVGGLQGLLPHLLLKALLHGDAPRRFPMWRGELRRPLRRRKLQLLLLLPRRVVSASLHG